MDEKPAFRPFLIPTLFLLICGWGGLALILKFSLPTIWPRWAFFALIVMAFTGSALPISFLLNQRVLANEARVVTRQALWVGIYAALLAWLQVGRSLNFPVALWLVLAFLGIEFVIQLRTGAPKPPIDDE
jgi:hypothetical protein